MDNGVVTPGLFLLFRGDSHMRISFNMFLKQLTQNVTVISGSQYKKKHTTWITWSAVHRTQKPLLDCRLWHPDPRSQVYRWGCKHINNWYFTHACGCGNQVTIRQRLYASTNFSPLSWLALCPMEPQGILCPLRRIGRSGGRILTPNYNQNILVPDGQRGII